MLLTTGFQKQRFLVTNLQQGIKLAKWTVNLPMLISF